MNVGVKSRLKRIANTPSRVGYLDIPNLKYSVQLYRCADKACLPVNQYLYVGYIPSIVMPFHCDPECHSADFVELRVPLDRGIIETLLNIIRDP